MKLCALDQVFICYETHQKHFQQGLQRLITNTLMFGEFSAHTKTIFKVSKMSLKPDLL